jgi:hypothetical protein
MHYSFQNSNQAVGGQLTKASQLHIKEEVREDL